MNTKTEAIDIPDSRLAREITELARQELSPLLFNHSSRVYSFGALTGKRRGLSFEPELLYAGAMFHDFGLMPAHASAHDRFEVDGANAARDFLKSRHIEQSDIAEVWTAIALHTTPGIPPYMSPTIALVFAGVEMDVLGVDYDKFSNDERDAVTSSFPRSANFKEDIIDAFNGGVKNKPETTFGNVKADVLVDKDPNFKPQNFCRIIRGSEWPT